MVELFHIFGETVITVKHKIAISFDGEAREKTSNSATRGACFVFFIFGEIFLTNGEIKTRSPNIHTAMASPRERKSLPFTVLCVITVHSAIMLARRLLCFDFFSFLFIKPSVLSHEKCFLLWTLNYAAMKRKPLQQRKLKLKSFSLA